MKTYLLDVDVISDGLGTRVIGSDVVVYRSTSSTNDIAWEHSAGGGNSGLCVFAEEQTGGRGRRGNTWVGEKGDSVLVSILLLGCDFGAELLAITSAVATAEVCNQPCNNENENKSPFFHNLLLNTD